MIFDTHMHSEFSFDSEMTVDEILEKQNKLNIGISLTEHVDLDCPNLPLMDVDKYLEFYKPYRSDSFLTGIELGMSEFCIEENKLFLQKHQDKFDIIIGSIHTLNKKDIYNFIGQTGLIKEEVYKDYLEAMLFSVKEFDFYDTLAHIDYICRYAKFNDKELYLEEYSEIIDSIFKVLIEKDKCLELNTRRLDDPKAFNNMLSIYTRYKNLGGKYVTLASDSHNKDDIAKNFEFAIDILNKTGLKPAYFKNRKRIVYDI